MRVKCVEKKSFFSLFSGNEWSYWLDWIESIFVWALNRSYFISRWLNHLLLDRREKDRESEKVCVCVCVREREQERGSERGSERVWERERERERERWDVWLNPRIKHSQEIRIKRNFFSDQSWKSLEVEIPFDSKG